jgi:type II secretory pathway pseudopilin PulG
MSRSEDHGYAMAALLVGLAVMSIMMSAALPVWRTATQREREAELIFRGEQYARAVELFQRKYAGAFPPNLDILLNERFLRRKYTDPMTDGEFQLLYVGQGAGQPGQVGLGTPQQQGGRGGRGIQGGVPAPPPSVPPPPLAQAGRGGRAGGPGAGLQTGIMGVTSKSTAEALRLYNGRGRYNEWAFVATAATTQAGAPTGGQPGRVGRGGRGDPTVAPGGGGPGRGPAPGRGLPPPGGRLPTPGGMPQGPGRGQRPPL